MHLGDNTMSEAHRPIQLNFNDHERRQVLLQASDCSNTSQP